MNTLKTAIAQKPFFSAFYTLCLINLVLLLVLFLPGLKNLAARWHEQAEYSHGYLIPLVAAYIAFERRHALVFLSDRWNAIGATLFLASLALVVIGDISALYLSIHLAFVSILISYAMVIYGKSSLNIVPAILFLLFAVPLPYVIESALTSNLQLLSSTFGVAIIRALNIPVYLSGNIIDLGSFKLHVVEACSGLRYLFPLLSIGALTAYFYSALFWKKLLLVVSCVPISVLMNSIRIAATGVLVKFYGHDVANEFVHAFEGWVVFVVCLALLLAELKLIEVLTSKKSFKEAFSKIDNAKSAVSGRPIQSIAGKGDKVIYLTVSSVMLVVAIIFLSGVNQRSDSLVLDRSLASFPMKLNDWSGHRKSLEPHIKERLGFSDYLLADYISSAGHLNLYIAYYANQRKGISPHSPKVCMPGGGWEINSIRLQTKNGQPVNRVEIQKGLQKQLVYYWFIERGRPIVGEYAKKLLLFKDAVFSGRTDGALIRIVVPIEENVPEIQAYKNAESKIDSFMSLAQDPIRNYLPPPI
ncbi:MAG: VPLPA-CTERM-specific exosortase XrtD [Agarilytica sp.]